MQLEEEAKKFSSRKEFKKGNPIMFNYAEKNKLLNSICKHMTRLHRLPWNEEELEIVAKECKSIGIMQKKYPGAYKAMIKKGLAMKFFGIEQKKLKRWTLEDAKREAIKYKSIKEVKEKNFPLFSAIKRHHWQIECYAHFS